MPTFSYKAMDQNGRAKQGQLDAFNENDLEMRLARIDLDLLTFKPAAARSRLLLPRKVGLKDLAMFCFQLEQLTNAGVPLLQGLTDLRDSATHVHFQKIIGTLVADVENGKLLSEALAAHPAVFGPVFVGLIRAGEQAGKLPEVFAKLTVTLKWQDELVAKTKRLLVYPLFVLCVVLATVIFLMVYLVPQMAIFLENLGQELPLETRLLIQLSHLLVGYWAWLLTLVLLIVLLATTALKHSVALRYRVDHIKLHLPVFGDILQKIILARFASYFALMYQAGIPVMDALKSCEAIVANRTVVAALDRVHQQINAGDSMSESFRDAGLFPSLVVRMIGVGESTGGLDRALLNISYFYDREVSESTEKMLSMLEPALTVVLGLILAGIMFAVLGPVYDSLSHLKI